MSRSQSDILERISAARTEAEILRANIRIKRESWKARYTQAKSNSNTTKAMPRQASSGIIVETCVDSVESACNAVAGGADRIELCGSLGLGGGVTPSVGLLKMVQKAVPDVPIMAMIRPRIGDFLYSDYELEVMVEDIRMFKECGVRGVVIGVLTAEGRVDVDRTKRLVDEALPLEVCFHRAFDMTRDVDEALEDIFSIGGVSRILTSGHGKSAPESLPALERIFKSAKKLTEEQPWALTILPGSGINARTVGAVLGALLSHGLQEVHLSGGSWLDGNMSFRPNGMGMGMGDSGEWAIWRTLEQNIAEVRLITDVMWQHHADN